MSPQPSVRSKPNVSRIPVASVYQRWVPGDKTVDGERAMGNARKLCMS